MGCYFQLNVRKVYSIRHQTTIMPGRGGRGKRSTFMCDIHTPKKTCKKCADISPNSFKGGYVGEVRSVNRLLTYPIVVVDFINVSISVPLCGRMRNICGVYKGNLVLVRAGKYFKYREVVVHRYTKEEISKLNIQKTYYPVDFDKIETEYDVPPITKPAIVISLHSILKKSLQSPCNYMNTDCLGTVRPYCVWDKTLLSVSVKVYNLIGELCKIYHMSSYNVREKEDLKIWVHDIITGERVQRECIEEVRNIVTDANLIRDYDISGIQKCEIRSKASCYSAYPPPTGWYCGSGFTLSYVYCE